MKKLFIVMLFLLPLAIQAQITLTRADFPKPTSASTMPDSVLYTNVTIGTPTAQSALGANKTWSETALYGNTTYQRFVAPSATPAFLQLVFFGSDYALNLTGGFGGGANVADGYEFYNYNTTSTRLEIKGTGFSITIPQSQIGIPVTAIYDNPDVLYRFPITYGNTDSTTSNFITSIPLPAPIGNVDIIRHQKRVNNVDAWGSITTPAGTYDVLRVASNLQREDSIVSSFISQGFPSNITEYKWLAQGKKIPVFSVTGTNAGGTFTPTLTTFWGQGPAPSAVNNSILSKNDLAVFPNPTTENATLNFSLQSTSNVDISILSITGQKVAEFHYANVSKGSHKELLPLHQLPSGSYFVTCKANNDVVTSKLIKL
jgi:hypothetical protein